jgi:hypothetical protein
MKELNINISKAQLVSYTVELKEGKPVVNASIALLTDSGEAITTYTIFSDDWHSKRFELPIGAMPLIGDLARILEGVAVRHCMGSQLALAAPEKATKVFETVLVKDVEEGDLISIDDFDTSPINLTDVPF